MMMGTDLLVDHYVKPVEDRQEEEALKATKTAALVYLLEMYYDGSFEIDILDLGLIYGSKTVGIAVDPERGVFILEVIPLDNFPLTNLTIH